MLSDLLEKRGINRNELSVEMGHGRDYVTNLIRENRTTTQTINYLYRVYGIDPDSYVALEAPAPEKKPTLAEIEASTLYTIIYDAVLNAVKDAMKEGN